MKEVIAKRSKTNFWIMLGIAVLAVALCVVNMLTQPNMKVLYIVGICIFGAATVICVVLLILPSTAIELHEKQLVVRIGLFKKAGIKLSQITDVCMTTNEKNPKEVLGDAVTIKYVIKKKHGQIVCGGIIDAPAVVEKIKALIGR